MSVEDLWAERIQCLQFAHAARPGGATEVSYQDAVARKHAISDELRRRGAPLRADIPSSSGKRQTVTPHSDELLAAKQENERLKAQLAELMKKVGGDTAGKA
jgi:hypothetical protein